MLKSLIVRATSNSALHLAQFNAKRGMHSRNKEAMELIAKGWNALREVDRVIDYCELNDKRLIPLLRTAKEHFELALEVDNSNTHARYWLSKLHLKYHVPGACKAIGAALLVEAADMGDPDAQYELGCRLRVENDYVQSDQQAFHYIEKAVDQLHPGALYLLGAVYLSGDCVKKDVASALWCFHRASEKGHAGAAIAYGSLLLRAEFDIVRFGLKSSLFSVGRRTVSGSITCCAKPFLGHWRHLVIEQPGPHGISGGVEVPESLTKYSAKSSSSIRASRKNATPNPLEMAREQFEIAAKAGCDLGFRWLKRLEEEEKRLLDV
ncbi:hypothetical protein LguiA_012383 [Lonicera macranthoides]